MKLSLKKGDSNLVSLDRKDSSKSYTKENTVFCCAEINIIKNDLSENKFKEICNKVYSNPKLKVLYEQKK